MEEEGRFALFLFKAARNGIIVSNDRSSLYGVLHGLKGRFSVFDDRVYRYCSDPAGGERLANGSGQGESLDSFAAQVERSG
jgi:hypothetical protein